MNKTTMTRTPIMMGVFVLVVLPLARVGGKPETVTVGWDGWTGTVAGNEVCVVCATLT